MIGLLALDARKQFVEQFQKELLLKFAVSNYQVWIFGSFLTDEFDGDSDIDIGVYCEDLGRLMELYHYIDEYMTWYGLDHDIVIVEMKKSHYINIPILMYGKPLTEYGNESWQQYVQEMAAIYGAQKLSRVEKAKQRKGIKIEEAYLGLEIIKGYIERLSCDKESYEYISACDGLATRFQELVQFVIDMATIMQLNEETNRLTDAQRSLRWAVGYAQSILKLSKEQIACLNMLVVRNDVVHDYISEDVYKEDIAEFFCTNQTMERLYEMIGLVKAYMIEKGIM